ncbi:MAG: hypothetical protein PHT02_10120 [Tissierellia bacterium]|nr:hypothetical protein [Tissierellia bacterium]
MAKIKVKELKNAVELNKTEKIKLIHFDSLEIEVLQTTTFQEKINLVATIFESAIDRDNGLHILNYNSLDLAYKVLLVEKYTNLTLPKDYLQSYDMLVSSEIYNKIYESIPVKELSDLNMVLENYIDTERDKYEQTSTIQHIVKDLLSGLIDKLPSKDEAEEFIKMASKEIEGFDPEKMEFVKQFLAKTSGENIG